MGNARSKKLKITNEPASDSDGGNMERIGPLKSEGADVVLGGGERRESKAGADYDNASNASTVEVLDDDVFEANTNSSKSKGKKR
ncbi:hypothetical protein EVAR_2897_1 [Eumeta japonica]|uniref:Uncharacterized protein n=1 Tax=Eumeta variegata TaxID=151549 RepID=A0A4C1T0P3_EUMVA|nr:hypothetical protein EVAR_2897_1 [Eumeta japonica]